MSPASTDRVTAAAPGTHAAAHAALSRSTLMTVRRVLHAYREGWLLEGRLATAARRIAEDARRAELSAAGMVVALEAAWAELDDVRSGSPLELSELLNRLVTHSIRAYYDRPRSSHHTRQDSDGVPRDRSGHPSSDRSGTGGRTAD